MAQQRSGRVPEGSGGRILQDPGLEAEADAFAAQAATAAPAPAPRRAARRVSRSVAQLNPAVVAPALVFAGLSAEAWGVAANVVGVLGAVGGTIAGHLRRRAARHQRLRLAAAAPEGDDRAGPEDAQQIAQFDIINAYVARYVERHPAEFTGPMKPPAEAPDTGEAPTGGATGEDIDQAVLQQVGASIETALEKALEDDLQTAQQEYMWSEGDARASSDKIGGTAGEADRGGVTGFLQLRNIQGVALKRELKLSPEAEQLVGQVPGNGDTLLVRRFFGGLVSGDATEAAFQSLTVNVEGGAPQESVGPDGTPLFIVRTLWYWDRWGFNTESRMETQIALGTTGKPWFGSVYEGSAD